MQYTKKFTLSALTLPPTRTVSTTCPLNFIGGLRTHTYTHTSMMIIAPYNHKSIRAQTVPFFLWPRAPCALSLAYLSDLQSLSCLLSTFTACALYILS